MQGPAQNNSHDFPRSFVLGRSIDALGGTLSGYNSVAPSLNFWFQTLLSDRRHTFLRCFVTARAVSPTERPADKYASAGRPFFASGERETNSSLCVSSNRGVASWMDHSAIRRSLREKSKGSFDRALTKSSAEILGRLPSSYGPSKQPRKSRQSQIRTSARRPAGYPASLIRLTASSKQRCTRFSANRGAV